jgi:cell surface protein SprA
MVSLYNKIPYFKKVNSRKRNTSSRKNTKFRGVSLNQLKGKKEPKDSTKTKKKDKDIYIMDYVAKLLMSVKNGSFSYVKGEGTLLPGYGQQTNIMGMDPNFNAPGLPFILGHQDNNYFREAADKGWLVEQPQLNLPSVRTYSERITARASVEPINGLRVELTANRTETSNFSTFFRYQLDTLTPDPFDGDWMSQSPVQNGTYSSSVILWKTAFETDDKDNTSEAFESFSDNRFEVSRRLAARDGITEIDSTGYYTGYGGESQEVILPAFYAAYTKGNASKTKLNLFDVIPLPGWRITFDGLSKIKAIKKFVRTIIISHGYNSDMNTSYVTNLRAGVNENTGARNQNEINGNFIPERQISTVTFTERFSPLINVDITWANSLSTKFEIKKDRTIALSMSNLNVNEVRGKELVVGLGYRLKGVILPFKVGSRTVKNDLNLRADFTIRDNTTIIRKMTEKENQLTTGRRIISIKTAADYSLSKNLNIRLYYDRQITKPRLSVPFPTSNSNFGFSLRYTLTS